MDVNLPENHIFTVCDNYYAEGCECEYAQGIFGEPSVL